MLEKNSLKGNLSFISLADLLQILGGNNSTGMLRLKTQYSPYSGIIYFRDGQPIDAALGPQKGLEAIYALFGWPEGDFEFQDGDIKAPLRIKKNRMEIVLDALRLLDDGKIKKVGDSAENEPDNLRFEDSKKNSNGKIPQIKGPLVDYGFIVGEDSFSNEKLVIKEGGHGKWLGVLYEGEAVIRRDTPEGAIDIVRLGAGSYIGTFKALRYGEYSRSASIYAEGNVGIYILNADRLHREYTSLSSGFQKLLLSLDHRLIRITDWIVDLKLKKAPSDSVPADAKPIVKKGSKCEDLYIIREGKAFVGRQMHKGFKSMITLNINDVFGYNPFMDIHHEPQTATVFGSADLKTEKLDIESLQNEYDSLSETLKNMIFHVGNCIITTTRLGNQYLDQSQPADKSAQAGSKSVSP